MSGLLVSLASITLAVALWGCNRPNTVEADSAALDVQPETVVNGLDTPWGMDFLPDGTLIFTERPGRVSVYAAGERRVENRVMYASDHRPRGHDETNILREGGNYGWPKRCGEDAKAIDPIRCYTDFTLAPGSIQWAAGGLYVTGLGGEQLRHITVRNGRVVSEEIVVRGLGRLRDVVARQGYLYFSTSNRDGRGNPGADDDRILRIRLVSGANASPAGRSHQVR